MKDDKTFVQVLGAIFGLILIALLVIYGKPPDEDVERALEGQGFTDIKVKSRAYFSCSESDRGGSHFTAKNPAGKTVTGVVCCGWLKACTVRF